MLGFPAGPAFSWGADRLLDTPLALHLLPPVPAALGADDRGGFKTVRQLMEPVIEEMQEAAAGEDDGMLIRAVSPSTLCPLSCAC